MKDLKDLYSEIMSSEELKKEFLDAAEKGNIEDFLKDHDCDASLEDVKAFLEEKQNETKELSLEEMDNVAGGTCNKATAKEATFSVLSFGITCTYDVIRSATSGTVGQINEESGRLCDKPDFRIKRN